ncbi:DUF2165 family protein [uncultured Paraglaciecola sp.]|uniref:DUF2165 family protein n=1 Tax=uncultured Paraglaciecola sp. TaxID=1765024 RepID=UPI002607B6DB|nr:DUF2165 family protein [uncultured Paraglaciecola sp.]
MAIRLLKVILVIFVGLQGALYVAGNLANYDAALGAVTYVLGMDGHTVYANHIFPVVSHSLLITIALLIILMGEFLVAALSLKGAWDLWQARHGSSQDFNAAKKFAILGAGTALVVWFGGFIVLGGALFQMWQTAAGAASFNGAFIYAATSGLVLLFVNAPD